jgi:hypothetical protein
MIQNLYSFLVFPVLRECLGSFMYEIDVSCRNVASDSEALGFRSASETGFKKAATEVGSPVASN